MQAWHEFFKIKAEIVKRFSILITWVAPLFFKYVVATLGIINSTIIGGMAILALIGLLKPIILPKWASVLMKLLIWGATALFCFILFARFFLYGASTENCALIQQNQPNPLCSDKLVVGFFLLAGIWLLAPGSLVSGNMLAAIISIVYFLVSLNIMAWLILHPRIMSSNK